MIGMATKASYSESLKTPASSDKEKYLYNIYMELIIHILMSFTTYYLLH